MSRAAFFLFYGLKDSVIRFLQCATGHERKVAVECQLDSLPQRQFYLFDFLIKLLEVAEAGRDVP